MKFFFNPNKIIYTNNIFIYYRSNSKRIFANFIKMFIKSILIEIKNIRG